MIYLIVIVVGWQCLQSIILVYYCTNITLCKMQFAFHALSKRNFVDKQLSFNLTSLCHSLVLLQLWGTLPTVYHFKYNR